MCVKFSCGKYGEIKVLLGKFGESYEISLLNHLEARIFFNYTDSRCCAMSAQRLLLTSRLCSNQSDHIVNPLE